MRTEAPVDPQPTRGAIGGATPQRDAIASVGCGPSTDLLILARSTWLTDLDEKREDGLRCDAAEVAGTAQTRKRLSGDPSRGGGAPRAERDRNCVPCSLSARP